MTASEKIARPRTASCPPAGPLGTHLIVPSLTRQCMPPISQSSSLRARPAARRSSPATRHCVGRHNATSTTIIMHHTCAMAIMNGATFGCSFRAQGRASTPRALPVVRRLGEPARFCPIVAASGSSYEDEERRPGREPVKLHREMRAAPL
ncbi:hypothetical protein BC628DRAFT_549425 [Trametes gibbosa]|nr:hypothetical protein BC628DRAFT_549425 [Trametes gibbosa]